MTERMVQYSVFLGKKPTVVAQLFRELAKAKINIVALTMMDSSEHAVLRLVAKDPCKAKDTLKKLDLPTDQTEVLAVTMPNKPGAAADVCERLSAGRIQISYLYSTTGAPGGKAVGIFKVSNTQKAEDILKAKRPNHRDMRVKLRNRQRAVARR